jgi:hypothetical protein
MTDAQKLEMKRFAHSMWTLLRYAAKMEAHGADIGGKWARTANILARRGFLIIGQADNGWRTVRLTDAGREAAASEGTAA